VSKRLAPLHRKTPPLATPLKRPDTIWVQPNVIVDIAFSELTEDGMLRHASFKRLLGLREPSRSALGEARGMCECCDCGVGDLSPMCNALPVETSAWLQLHIKRGRQMTINT
jgi:hypothetical protein